MEESLRLAIRSACLCVCRKVGKPDVRGTASESAENENVHGCKVGKPLRNARMAMVTPNPQALTLGKAA